ncbi:TPA: glutamate--cysteine ligase [Legionella pneumophila]|uniref:Glutamate--cysteine ligase n=4 Tax=Gammaproteobacteria TaxID=1236 RepID=A0A2S6EYL4_LEGPN|nr:glutamate--cysteine ligase [Legionella pneumophila]APF03470.1 glutamate--cysteine ligase [Legionella pneumophila subsp. fraseri]APF06500.1 glutamate--cysteine ligase [Legionella pneumophila subsp. fraseri]AUB68956.1 glutamate--cysteine ligase [Legionella pneumophila]AUB71929.1 glutamate--cysteine ligase [Legionella pneumophila]KXB26272.1 glutamate--cysteine ligase [Legionella pneumophila]
MDKHEIPVPHLTTAHSGPLHHVEKIILNKLAEIESWFRKKWQETPAPLTSSVDLRHAGFKLAPVDTNLFPAGFNNLNPEFLPLCIQAAQSALIEYIPDCTKILLLPESHTRNKYYLQSLNVLKTIFVKAGFIVRIGSLDPEIKEPTEIILEQGETLLIEPLQRQGDRVGLDNFSPCLLLLNNDLSSGVPEILQGVQQRIRPTAKLGWASRLKSSHFQFFEEVAIEFAELVGIDPWLINPYFSAIEGVDFMAQEGIETLAQEVDKILSLINDKYTTYGIENKPFAVVKADNGTYGMSVMMVHDGDEIRQLNRKQRTRMSTSKGSRKVDRVIIQEGVYTFETMPDGSVAEPVVYMIGQFVVGGFYRVHKGRGIDENLNAPGMHFEPLAFAQACNMPCDDLEVVDCPNRFYVYGVIARLAALAAAREIAAIGGE